MKTYKIKLINSTLKPWDISQNIICKNITHSFKKSLSQLMYNSYLNTVDYEGETIDDAAQEINAVFEGKYGPLNEGVSYVALLNDTVVSASLITYNPDPILIYLMTDKDYKRKGFASEIMKRSINSLISDRQTKLSLYVSSNNQQALNLYKKFHFL